MTKRKKAKFRVGDHARCIHGCKATKITAVVWDDRFGQWFYRLGREKFSESVGGHESRELRKEARR